MEQVRARAGVGKATLYRRYGSKQELVAEAIRHLNQPIDVPDTGAVREDILAVARSVMAGCGGRPVGDQGLARSSVELHGLVAQGQVADSGWWNVLVRRLLPATS